MSPVSAVLDPCIDTVAFTLNRWTNATTTHRWLYNKKSKQMTSLELVSASPVPTEGVHSASSWGKWVALNTIQTKHCYFCLVALTWTVPEHRDWWRLFSTYLLTECNVSIWKWIKVLHYWVFIGGEEGIVDFNVWKGALMSREASEPLVYIVLLLTLNPMLMNFDDPHVYLMSKTFRDGLNITSAFYIRLAEAPDVTRE